MNMADQLRQEGREQGILKGILKGETTLLQRQLERKFGALSLSDLNKLQTATAEQVLSWSDRILDAQNLADVFKQP